MSPGSGYGLRAVVEDEKSPAGAGLKKEKNQLWLRLSYTWQAFPSERFSE